MTKIRVSKLRKQKGRYSIIAPNGYMMKKVLRNWNEGEERREFQFDLKKED